MWQSLVYVLPTDGTRMVLYMIQAGLLKEFVTGIFPSVFTVGFFGLLDAGGVGAFLLIGVKRLGRSHTSSHSSGKLGLPALCRFSSPNLLAWRKTSFCRRTGQVIPMNFLGMDGYLLSVDGEAEFLILIEGVDIAFFVHDDEQPVHGVPLVGEAFVVDPGAEACQIDAVGEYDGGLFVLFGISITHLLGMAVIVIDQILPEVYSDNLSLTSAKLPDSLLSINHEAFYNCSNLSWVNISEGFSYIGEKAFHGVSGTIYVEKDTADPNWDADCNNGFNGTIVYGLGTNWEYGNGVSTLIA